VGRNGKPGFTKPLELAPVAIRVAARSAGGHAAVRSSRQTLRSR
jgi:hypothetical protein